MTFLQSLFRYQPKPRHLNVGEDCADVTVILTVWKRNYLEQQIECLLSQSIRPKNIWVQHCCNHVNVTSVLRKYDFLEYIKSSIDLKYFSRFSTAVHVNSKYTWVLDDDIIPSKTWLSTCLNYCDSNNAIITSNGRIIPKNDYYPEKIKGEGYFDSYFIGDCKSGEHMNTAKDDTFVDFPCSSFFFKSEWIKHFWSVWPITFKTGEDIHFACTCQLAAGIRTLVPRQVGLIDSGNIKPEYSGDQFASWKRSDFIEDRSEVLRYFINVKKWVPLQWQHQNIV